MDVQSTTSEGAYVLVVEDDHDIREAIREFLEFEGVRVVAAEHGRAALDQLGRDPDASLVLLDLMMPVMDGATFLKHKQKSPSLSGIPVVVITASAGPLPDGVQLALRKPFDLDRLAETVRRFQARHARH